MRRRYGIDFVVICRAKRNLNVNVHIILLPQAHNGKCRRPECFHPQKDNAKSKHCKPNLDPELNWSFPRIGCDPPPSLLESGSLGCYIILRKKKKDKHI